jgi:hypothetical protein
MSDGESLLAIIGAVVLAIAIGAVPAYVRRRKK